MPGEQLARINGDVLRWARERVGETLETLGPRVNVDAATVGSWETGVQSPAFRKAQKLA